MPSLIIPFLPANRKHKSTNKKRIDLERERDLDGKYKRRKTNHHDRCLKCGHRRMHHYETTEKTSFGIPVICDAKGCFCTHFKEADSLSLEGQKLFKGSR